MRYHVAVKAAILLFLLSVPVLADLAAGQRALRNGDYATALLEILPLAKQGDPLAQVVLGSMYDGGIGVPQDYKEALRWYRLAAEQGNAVAQFIAGVMYHEGQGVQRDDKEAAKWYRLAAEQGNVEVQWSLGWMYYRGEGAERNLGCTCEARNQGRSEAKSDSKRIAAASAANASGSVQTALSKVPRRRASQQNSGFVPGALPIGFHRLGVAPVKSPHSIKTNG